MTGINLKKGGRINLSKDFASVTKWRIALGWRPNAFDSGKKFDLDASIFICTPDAAGESKLISNDYFVFYGSAGRSDPLGSVVHSGDNRTGEGADEFDEYITVDTAKLHQSATELSIVVTIHEGAENGQNFGQVTNSVIALFNDETNEEVARYSLEDDFSNETAVQFGSLYKKDGSWLFKAVGAGYNRGLADFVVAYGGTID